MATISADRKNGGSTQQAARCGKHKGQPATLSPAGSTADGFLRQRFLPLYERPEKLPPKKQCEEGFFSSLSILTKLHEFSSLDVSDKPYPYNILLAHWDISGQLNTQNQQVELNIMREGKHAVYLETSQTYDTGNKLYFIPVLPVYRLLRDRTSRKAGELILSVFAYLYHVAGVPFYREEGNDIETYYEIMQEWLYEEGNDTEMVKAEQSQLNAAAFYGDEMHRKIYNTCHLGQFEQRVTSFHPKNELEDDCLKVARTAFSLFCDYPGQSAFSHINTDEWEGNSEDEDDYDNKIRMTQYLSFVAEVKGCLFDSIERMVNETLNEYGAMEEPCAIQLYKEPTTTLNNGLSFEHRFFDLLIDLCNLLTDMP